MREHLKAFYLEYVNDYLTVQAMSDYKHMTEADTQSCIDMGRRIHEEDVARAKPQCGYVAFFNGKRHELHASSLYEAKQAAVKHFTACLQPVRGQAGRSEALQSSTQQGAHGVGPLGREAER